VQGTETPPPKPQTFAQSMRMWLVLSAALAFFGILILRLGLRLNWSGLAIPVAILAGLPLGFAASMFWASKHKHFRIEPIITGVYAVGLASTLGHYASQWGLHTGVDGSDLRWFDACMGVISVGMALLPRQWLESLRKYGVMCERCHHYHEGRDCRKCGCRADQFKYPIMGI
jgi:hypothetical protein